MNEKLITDLVDLNPEVLPEGKMPEVLGEYTVTATFGDIPLDKLHDGISQKLAQLINRPGLSVADTQLALGIAILLSEIVERARDAEVQVAELSAELRNLYDQQDADSANYKTGIGYT